MAFEVFATGFFQRALVAGLLTALFSAGVGFFLVLRRLSLLADVLSHSALGGIALGLFLGFNPVVGALAATLGSALGLHRLQRMRIPGDVVLAVFFSAGIALSVLLLGLAGGFNVSLFSFLFGSILTVSMEDVLLTAVLAGVGLLAIGLLFKELAFVTYDSEAAEAAGLPVAKLELLLLVLSALGVIVAVRTVGVFLVSSLLVLPAAAGTRLRLNFRESFLVTLVIAILSLLLGLGLSVALNLPAGGTIVAVLVLVFLASLVAGGRT